jgi:hypothetical protein
LNWFAHLGNHRVRVLWRFHELHHSQEDMSVLTVFRTHPLIHVSYLIALIPGVVLLANGSLPTTLLVIYAGIVAFAHSNTNLGFGPLGRIFVSPNYHRIHHMLDGPQDVNLGFVLTVWDQLFHRAVFPTSDTIRTDTGLPGRPLIVEQSTLRPRHFSVFLAQLVAPFRPMHDRTALPSIRDRVATPRSGQATPNFTRRGLSESPIRLSSSPFFGADDRIRTRDPYLGKVTKTICGVGARVMTCPSRRRAVHRVRRGLAEVGHRTTSNRQPTRNRWNDARAPKDAPC